MKLLVAQPARLILLSILVYPRILHLIQVLLRLETLRLRLTLRLLQRRLLILLRQLHLQLRSVLVNLLQLLLPLRLTLPMTQLGVRRSLPRRIQLLRLIRREQQQPRLLLQETLLLLSLRESRMEELKQK